MNSDSFTPHTLATPMQHLQAVIVRNSKPLRFCFGEQESEPYPLTQMSDRPTHSSHTFYLESLQNYCYWVATVLGDDSSG